MGVEVRVAYDLVDQIMAEFQPRIDAALEVAGQVGTILRSKALLDNEDAFGNQMAQKQAKPKKTPIISRKSPSSRTIHRMR